MSEPAQTQAFAPAAEPPGDATVLEQWAAVEGAARVVAMLARRPQAPATTEVAEQIGMLVNTVGPNSDPALFALQELVVTMRVGLDALLCAHGTAADPVIAANRLWGEYERGRAKVLRETSAALACQDL